MFKHLSSDRFKRIFLRNLSIIWLAVVLPLIAVGVSVYSYSSSSVIGEIDAANRRGLEKTKNITEQIIKQSYSTLLSFCMSDDIKQLLKLQRPIFADFEFYSLSTKIRSSMQIGIRQNLDISIDFFSKELDHTISTIYGGQLAQYYDDRELIDFYNNNSFKTTALTYRTLNKSTPVLTFYRNLSADNPGKQGFMALTVDLRNLMNYISPLGDNSDTLIINRNNVILADSKIRFAGQDIDSVFEDSELVQTVSQTDTGVCMINFQGNTTRLTWDYSAGSELKYIQLVPFSSYRDKTNNLLQFLLCAILIASVISLCVAFAISLRLFKPMADILSIIENPNTYNAINDYNGEIKYILMNTLNSFQKNILLEDEMLKRITVLRNTRVKALQEQISPHFLYNTLQAIYWLAVEEMGTSHGKTTDALMTISQIIRTGLENSNNLTTVIQEVEYTQKYLQILLLRYGDKIQCTFDVDASAEKVYIPLISIQPIVENAVSHGINSAKDKLLIAVKAECTKHELIVSVDDNGAGMTDCAIADYTERFQTEFVYVNNHIGLVNLNQRLKLIYGEDIRLYLSHSEYGGLRVQFAVPLEVNTASG